MPPTEPKPTTENQDPLSVLFEGRSTERPFKLVTIPGHNGELKVALWGLGADEIGRCTAAAWDYLTTELKCDERKIQTIPEYYAHFQHELKVQQLYVGLRKATDTTQRAFKFVSDVRRLEPDMTTWLFEQLSDYAAERSPTRKIKTLDELDQYVDELGKGLAAARDWLSSLDTVSLRIISTELAARCLMQTRLNSSDISSQSDINISLTLPSDPAQDNQQ